MEKEKTACITGHRPKGLPWGYNETKENCKRFKVEVRKIFTETIECGISTFITGMAEGFDMIATEILIELKKIYKHIKIVAAIPCLNQEIRWSLNQQERYRRILEQCDKKIVLSEIYTPSCMNERNLYMVQHSSVCIACWNGSSSGTYNTIQLAKYKSCKIQRINPNDFK